MRLNTGEIKKGTALILAIITACTFLLPREVFDPHPGVDTDIFCRTMSVFNSGILSYTDNCQVPVYIFTILVVKEIIPGKENFRLYKSIRAPPTIAGESLNMSA